MAGTVELYRFTGEGEARCGDCVIEVLAANPRMRMSDWVEDELGDTSCDACDAARPTGRDLLLDLQAHRIARATAPLYANAGLRFDVDAHFAVKAIALAELS